MVTALSLAALACYAYGFYLQFRRLRAGTEAADSGHAAASNLTIALTTVAILFHAYVTYRLLFPAAGFSISLVAVSNLVALLMVVVVALANLRLPVSNLNLFLFPISLVTLLAAVSIPPGTVEADPFTAALVTHILLSLAAYTTLMMAACQSGLLAIQERQLKSHTMGLGHILPPLESMERLLLAMLWTGLVLLTASILSGFFFLENMFDQQVVHHTVLTSLSWLVYVFFIAGRYLFGWRGLTAVRWTLVAFALLVLGYFGSKFVLEYLIST